MARLYVESNVKRYRNDAIRVPLNPSIKRNNWHHEMSIQDIQALCAFDCIWRRVNVNGSVNSNAKSLADLGKPSMKA